MADVNNPKVGDVFYFKGRTQVTVTKETKQGGGVNDDALVQVETNTGIPYLFFYSTSARFLSATKVPFYKSWPLSVKAVR